MWGKRVPAFVDDVTVVEIVRRDKLGRVTGVERRTIPKRVSRWATTPTLTSMRPL